MAMLIWVAFCCFVVKTCLAADNNTPVGFKSIQKCREYQQEPIQIATSLKMNVPIPAPIQEHASSASDPDRIIFARSIGPKQKATKFPYAASIYDQRGIHQCGGTLISDKFVLTNAHCLNDKRFIMTYVVFGTDEIDPLARNFLNISKTIPHPHHFNANQYYNDIGLIELAEPVVFSKRVRPACLSSRRYSDYDEWFLVTWVPEGEPASTKKQRKVTVTTGNCQEIYQDVTNVMYGVIDHLQICVEEHIEATKHYPISIVVSNKEVSGYTVVGIPSFGYKLKNTNQIYTRVAGYIKWIESIVWPDLPTRGCNKFNFLLDK